MDKIDENMNIDDDRSACSDSWEMQFVSYEPNTDSNGDLISENLQYSQKGEMINQHIMANTL